MSTPTRVRCTSCGVVLSLDDTAHVPARCFIVRVGSMGLTLQEFEQAAGDEKTVKVLEMFGGTFLGFKTAVPTATLFVCLGAFETLAIGES